MAAAAADVDGAAFTALLQLLPLLLLVFSYVFSNQMSEAANRAEPIINKCFTIIEKERGRERSVSRVIIVDIKLINKKKMKIKIYGCNKNKENCILIYKTKVRLDFYYFNKILINFKTFIDVD